MPVTADIAASYRGPGRVIDRLWAAGRREDRALMFALLASALIFVAQAPWQARLAHLEPDPPLEARLYWSALFLIFLLPFGLYVIAGISQAVLWLFGHKGGGYAARLALFWALLASTPVILLAGMVAGFIGPGPGLQAIGALWVAVFLWFWGTGLARTKGAA